MTKWLKLVSRMFLGILFLGAGINGYFVIFDLDPFIATSPEAMALFEFKYLLIVEKTLEVVCGILLLTKQFIPLALAILSPIVTNILLLHIFLDHSLLPLAIVIVIAFGHLLFSYRKSFMSLLVRKAD